MEIQVYKNLMFKRLCTEDNSPIDGVFVGLFEGVTVLQSRDAINSATSWAL